MTRRALLLAACGVPLASRRAQAAGVHLTGRFDATETERSEQILNFGRAFALVVHDPSLWRALQPLIGPEIQISIVHWSAR